MDKINFKTYEIKEMPVLELKDINSAYIGKPNTCMCGCSGEYFYLKVNQEKAGNNRGYGVADEEINDKKVMGILAKITKNAYKGIEVIENRNKYIFTLILGNKQYTLYTL